MSDGYISFDKTANNHVTVPDPGVGTDLEVRFDVALNDVTPAAIVHIVGQWQNNTDRSYYVVIPNSATDVFFRIYWSDDGTGVGGGNRASASVGDALGGLTAGERFQGRVTFDVDTGASNSLITFYARKYTGQDLESDTGWTQLSASATGSVESIWDSSDVLEVGELGDWPLYAFDGDMYRVIGYDGIGGSLLYDVDFTRLTPAEISNGSFSERANNRTATIVGSDSVYVPNSEAWPHGDALVSFMAGRGESFTSVEVVGALNEINGTQGVEYAQARATYLGVDPAG